VNKGRTSLGGTLIVSLAVLGFTGCTPTEPTGPLEGLPYDVATYEPSGSGGDSAGLTGMLTDQDGCLVIEEEQGEHILPIWPRPMVSSSDGRLKIAGSTYELGNSVAVGGGFADAFETDLPQACASLDLSRFIVAND